MKHFEDKTAVKTGGASGIGRAIAQRCLAEGMNVVLADIEEKTLDETAVALGSDHPERVMGIATDVCSEADLERLRDKTLQRFGGIHLLCNNAGVGAGAGMLDSSMNDWRWTMDVNLWSVVNGCRLFLPAMIDQDEDCHIVNTASAAGLTPYNPSVSYTVSKYGVVALSESLHIEMKSLEMRVGVSVLCPGFIKTRIMDSARNRPDHLQDAAEEGVADETNAAFEAMRRHVDAGMPAEDVAIKVLDSIRAGDLYILTHDINDVLNLRNKIIKHGGGLEPLSTLEDFR